MILTNGAVWRVYKMRFEKPIKSTLVFSLDLLEASPKDAEVIERFYTLSRRGIAKSAIEEFQEEKAALNPFLVGAVLLSDPVISVLRRELRRITPGARVDPEELIGVVREEVVKREVVEGDEARRASGKAKRAAGRALRKKRKKKVDRKDADALTETTDDEDELRPV